MGAGLGLVLGLGEVVEELGEGLAVVVVEATVRTVMAEWRTDSEPPEALWSHTFTPPAARRELVEVLDIERHAGADVPPFQARAEILTGRLPVTSVARQTTLPRAGGWAGWFG